MPTTLDIGIEISPLIDLINALPTLLQAFIPVVLVIVVLIAVMAVGNMVNGLFGKIGHSLGFRKK